MLGEPMPDLSNGLALAQPKNDDGISDKVLFTAFEIKEKLNNFIKSLEEEGKSTSEINKLLEFEKVELSLPTALLTTHEPYRQPTLAMANQPL
jgi:hypothetical protein